MKLRSHTAMVAIAATFATAAVAQNAEPPLPQGLQWAVSPQVYLAKWGWGNEHQKAAKGAALVTCDYDARGVLKKCFGIDENPANSGLARIAAAVAQEESKLKTKLSDGSALTPGTFTFVVVFRSEDKVKSRLRPRNMFEGGGAR